VEGQERVDVNLKEVCVLPDQLKDGALAKGHGMVQFLERVDGDLEAQLSDLQEVFGRFYGTRTRSLSVIDIYGGDAAAARWTNNEKIQILVQTYATSSIYGLGLESCGAPTAGQLPLVIQRLIYVAGGRQGVCPVKESKRVRQEPALIAEKITCGMELAKQGLAECNSGKLLQAADMLRMARIEVCVYASARDRSGDDIFSQLEMSEDDLVKLIDSLDNGSAGSQRQMQSAHFSLPAPAQFVSKAELQKVEDALLETYVKEGRFVLEEKSLGQQLQLIAQSIMNPKSGLVLIDVVDEHSRTTAGLSIRSGTSIVSLAAARRYNQDLTRWASMPAMVSLLAFNGLALTLRQWNFIESLGDRDFNFMDKTAIQDVGTGKVPTRLGQSVVYARLVSVSDVGGVLRNISDAFSSGFENSDLFYNQSLIGVARILEQKDRASDGLLPVNVVGPAVQDDLQQWVGRIRGGAVQSFALSEETASMIERLRSIPSSNLGPVSGRRL
ncbi:hypothetical protein M885DRAFT_603689, partial [Pelagophyceae sp. CCMP2097]